MVRNQANERLGAEGQPPFVPDTDLDNLRNRVVGILFGLFVTALVFHYMWAERAQKKA